MLVNQSALRDGSTAFRIRQFRSDILREVTDLFVRAFWLFVRVFLWVRFRRGLKGNRAPTRHDDEAGKNYGFEPNVVSHWRTHSFCEFSGKP
jgi:hypothetical protein